MALRRAPVAGPDQIVNTWVLAGPPVEDRDRYHQRCWTQGHAAAAGAGGEVRGYKTAIAVSTVVIFGTLSMFLYPVMYRTGMLNGMTDTEVAVYTGSTLHEVAHVAGAGNAMDPTDALGIAGTATITKMIRVMLLAPVLVIMGFVLAGRRKEPGAKRKTQDRRAVVRLRVYRGHRSQFAAAKPLRGGDGPGNSAQRDHRVRRYLHADDGHDGAGDRNEPRQIQAGGARPFVLAGLLYVWLVAGGYFVTKYVVGML